MSYGLSFLAAPKYPKLVLSYKDFPINSFEKTFGEFYPLAEKLLGEGCPKIQVGLMYKPDHNFGDSDRKNIRDLSSKYNKLQLKHRSQPIIIQPFVEHTLIRPDKLMDIAQDSAPDCTILNNPGEYQGRRGSLSFKYPNEVHTFTMPIPQGRFNFGTDGLDLYHLDRAKLKHDYAKAEITWLWHYYFNLKTSMTDSTPINQRRKIPSDSDVKSLLALMR